MPSPVTFEQCAAIYHRDGHALVSAVAGSGKSTTLIERIAYLLAHGADARRILVLMFNKSARDDFAARLERRLPAVARPAVSTFHSFGMRLCNSLVHSGILPSAKLLATPRECIRFTQGILTTFNAGRPDTATLASGDESLLEYLDIFDLLKGSLYVVGDPPPALPIGNNDVLAFFPVFEQHRKASGVRFFADLISDPVAAAIASSDVASFIANRYDHIIVDEFQDINEAQIRMLSFLAGDRAQVMAVGDDDQTIYGWRGANPDYMTHLFAERFPGVTTYTIGTSFRYGQAVALMADHVISNNSLRTDKRCLSAENTYTVPHVRLHQSGCGQPVVEELLRWQHAGRLLSEAAILVRHYANALPVEIALHKAAIPYRMVGSAAFVDRTEVVALRGFLQLACGGLGRLSPDGSIEQTLSAMFVTPPLFLRQELACELIESVKYQADDAIGVISSRLSAETRVKPFQKRGWEECMANWLWCSKQRADSPAGAFLDSVYVRFKLFAHLARNNPRIDVANEKVRLLRQLVEVAFAGKHSCQSFLSFLDELSRSMTNPAQTTESVLITSVHRSKGMEWPMVILPDLSDGQFPYCTLNSTTDEVEDERRLFYVAMTRARHELVLVAPFDPQLVRWSLDHCHGHPDLRQIKASRFLYEANIDKALQLATKSSSEIAPRKAVSIERENSEFAV